ncbi:NCS1 nucleoside transporter family [Sulfobacillus thermosulfidooxidans DSM 9293]|uniref:NCS1 nucleoside transporter family n=4 Tax=Sulfobacillus thermosulfidooxidans TaxID=28034 RepID=A0A1W1WI03_SULTA|nr:NCS1 nucleoside transporter family [Sulfobacillus thermosulfidooxidans DSM 9293]
MNNESNSGPSPLLYNADIAPVSPERKTWNAWALFGVWASIASPSSMLVGSAGIVFGFNWWQVVTIALIGDLVTLVALIVQSHGAIIYGLAEPQLDRTRFGIWGTFIPSWARFLVGLGFWGVQTFLITEALVSLWIIAMGHRTALLALHSLSPGMLVTHYPLLFWTMFVIATSAQYVILLKAQPILSAPSLKWLSRWMPLLSIAVLTFVFIDFVSRYPIALTQAMNQPAAPLTSAIIPVLLVFLSSNIHATQVISWPDMMRFGTSVRAMLLGQLGLPIIYTMTIIYGALMTGVVHSLTGHTVYDPILLVAGFLHPNWLTIIVLFFYAALLMNTNIFSNSIPPVYDLNNTWPKHLTWTRGVTIVTILGIAIGAWSLYAQGAYKYFNTWILFVASLLGPFAGVIIVDYVLIQRGHLNVSDIYRLDGRYYFYRGFNIRAIIAVAVALFVVFMGHFGLSFPGWTYLSKASWLTGAVIAGLCYMIIMPRQQIDVSKSKIKSKGLV